MNIAYKNYFFIIIYIIEVFAYFYTGAMHNQELSNVFTVLMFTTLALYYLFSFKGKINYLFLSMLLFQAVGDIYFVRDGEQNFLIGLTLYFLVNFTLVLMLKNRIEKFSKAKPILKLILPLALLFTIIFLIALFLGLIKVITTLFGLMMLLLVWVSYKYFTLQTKDSSFWLLFGVAAYLVCSLASSFDIFIAENIYYKGLKVLAYVVAMFCVTKAAIIENKKINE